MISAAELRNEVNVMSKAEFVAMRGEFEANWSEGLREAMAVLAMASISRFKTPLSKLEAPTPSAGLAEELAYIDGKLGKVDSLISSREFLEGLNSGHPSTVVKLRAEKALIENIKTVLMRERAPAHYGLPLAHGLTIGRKAYTKKLYQVHQKGELILEATYKKCMKTANGIISKLNND
jgi:hypothetical protein